MPARNMAKAVSMAIESVQRQTYQDWELIVVDDGSTDETFRVVSGISELDPRVRILRNPGAPGTGNARNHGIRNAARRFLAFLDADDLWLPWKLEIQISAMERQGLPFSYTSVIRFNARGQVSSAWTPAGDFVTFKQLLRTRPIVTSSVVLDRTACGEVEFPNLPRAQDLACWLSILRHVPRAYRIPEQEASVLYSTCSTRNWFRQAFLGFRYSSQIYKNQLNLPFWERIFNLGAYAFWNISRNLLSFRATISITAIRKPQEPYYAFLTTRMPYPPFGGDRLRAHHMLKGLERVGRCRVIHVSNAAPPANSVIMTLWNDNDLVIRQLSTAGCLFRAFAALASRRPLQVAMFDSPIAKRRLRSHVQGAKGVLAMLVRTAPLALLGQGKRVLDLTDSIGLHYQEAATRTNSILWSLIYRIEGPRLLAYETAMTRIFDHTTLVNAKETEFFKFPERVHWITNGVNPALLKRPLSHNPTKDRVCFLGKMDYRPNIDACLWFIRNVLPILPSDIGFMIIGMNPGPEFTRLAAESNGRIVVTGFLDDPFTEMTESLAVIAPMQTGGGVQNKMLEALALGCLVLSSRKAASAIGSESDSPCLLVMEEPEEYVAAILEVQKNPNQFDQIRSNARDFITSYAHWDEIYPQIARLFQP